MVIVCIVMTLRETRGILNYVKDNICSKQIMVTEAAKECLLLNIQINKNDNLYVATIYRSPNSTLDHEHNKVC